MINVTVWNEFRHEKTDRRVSAVYPEGIHAAIAGFLKKEPDFSVKTATLDEPEHGLPAEVLDSTDVLIWWSHMAQGEVSDGVVQKIFDRVVSEGMGFIALHSSHASKPFVKFSGSAANKLSWREDNGLERIFIVEPSHPIARGLPEYFEIPRTEMYGEYFCISAPDDLIGISWFEGGEVLRSVFSYNRGLGKVVYIRPGHETLPIFENEHVQMLIVNAVRYAGADGLPKMTFRSNIKLPR